MANETVGGESLIEALRRRAAEGETDVTVLSPVNPPRQGYVVYEDTRRASAGRRLDRTLARLREAGIPAHGMVVESDPADAVRDQLHQLDQPPDEIIVSTHPLQKSGWLRRNVVDRIRSVAGDIPVEHVVVEQTASGERNVLVIANDTVVGEKLLDRIRARAAQSPASFLLISPQSDPGMGSHPEAERRLRAALTKLREAGIDAHGQVAHPDPYTAAMQAIADERVDEIIVSTFPGEKASSWLRRDVVGRLRKDSGVPVEHVVVEADSNVAGAV